MAILFKRSSYVIFGAFVLIAIALSLLVSFVGNGSENYITATVERGDVVESVSVSGFVEAKNTAELGFPTTGKITEVFVDEGSVVIAGEVLATLGSNKLVADRNEALASLRIAEAAYSETLAGPTETARAVTNATVENARNNLAFVTAEQEERVRTAKAKLLSDGLSAYTNDEQERTSPPTISGTYACEREGTYQIEVYPSGSVSGYSYRVTGLETGGQAVSSDQATRLGNCGLFIEFDEPEIYDKSNWTVEIPNSRSASYVTNKNAYELALAQQETALQTARDNLVLVSEQATEANASARTEVVTQKQAAISQARARIAQIDALLADRSIVAPFSGTVTDVQVIPGETAGTEPVITVLAEDAFELTARIPEIDIRKISPGQRAIVTFDANPDEELLGRISYVSPLATQIDGVAYFETTIVLEENPTWLRSGLNSDIEIIINEEPDVLKIPQRYLRRDDGDTQVELLINNKRVLTPIEVIFAGNDGYVGITGLTEGDAVVAP